MLELTNECGVTVQFQFQKAYMNNKIVRLFHKSVYIVLGVTIV